jgi:hypothetical protein
MRSMTEFYSIIRSRNQAIKLASDDSCYVLFGLGENTSFKILNYRFAMFFFPSY